MDLPKKKKKVRAWRVGEYVNRQSTKTKIDIEAILTIGRQREETQPAVCVFYSRP